MTEMSDHGGDVFSLSRSLGMKPEDLIDFSASINPLGPAPGVREALAASFDRIVHYPDLGAAELRHALARLHGVSDVNIAVANGSTELLYLLPRILAGRRGLVVAPAFSEYATALTQAGWRTEYHLLSATDGFALSLELLAGQLAKGVDVLFLCNPGNPHGALLPRATVEAVHRLCLRSGTFLILDEAFMDFCEAESAKQHFIAEGNGIVLRSMTKFYAIPGLRLGYALGKAEIVGRISSLLGPWSVNTLAQVAGVVSLADPDYRERTIRLCRQERDFLAAGLASLPGLRPYPAAANYLLVELPGGMTAPELRESLLRHCLMIRDCSNFLGLDERFFRIAVKGHDNNCRLLEALAGVLAGAG